MAKEFERGHLTPERIQEFLDDRLLPEEAGRVQEHLSVCVSCQAEVEVWDALFSDLGGLLEVAPSQGFADAVMARTSVRAPAKERLKVFLPGFGSSKATAESHVSAEGLQEFLEGALPGRQAARVAAHLSDCGSCRRDVRGWERLFASLKGLGHLRPSAGFAARVMALVRVPARVPERGWHRGTRRALAWARGFLPRTRRGWAIAGGVASAPTITFGALAYLVFSHPLLNAGSLATYLWWKLGSLLSAAASAVGGAVVESVALFRIYAVLGALRDAPYLVGAGGLVFTALSAWAFWVLYRNVISAPPMEKRYARIRV